MELKDKVVVVTGATGDVGPGVCLTLAKDGAKVVCVANNRDRLDALQKRMDEAGYTAMTISCDITCIEKVQEMRQKIHEVFGPIDMLVNMAGGVLFPYGLTPEETQFMDKDFEQIRKVINLNLFGTLICTHELAKDMVEMKQGKIVNVGSIDGIRGSDGKADYAASKGGIIAFTKSMAQELSRYHIYCNSVCLGQISNGREKDNSKEDSWAKYGKGALVGRFGEPEEVGYLISFLLSNKSDYITGQNYIIGGGCYL